MKRNRLSRNKRKRFTVYTPDYKHISCKERIGTYKTVYIWRQVIQLIKKKGYGEGSRINEQHLFEDRFGGISFWNVMYQWEWF